MSNFRAIDRQSGYVLPPSVDEWLPERHLARFIGEVIGGLDLGPNRARHPEQSHQSDAHDHFSFPPFSWSLDSRP